MAQNILPTASAEVIPEPTSELGNRIEIHFDWEVNTESERPAIASAILVINPTAESSTGIAALLGRGISPDVFHCTV